ncbi:hypothetical protein MTR_0044s0050 [Medicago truncatula]|uniref:Uncharacterized protein n=1 Tax=Medicago truncatula TaxID=3880 RepID=G7ZUP5_MEDTR|nr:hypothetical protein MTR_0044s0050 [Medicago truncatula]
MDKLKFDWRTTFLTYVPKGSYDAIIVNAFDLGPMPKSDESAGTNDTFIPNNNIHRPRGALCLGRVLCIQGESFWFKSLDIEQLLIKSRQIFKGSNDYSRANVPVNEHVLRISQLELLFHSYSFCSPSIGKRT